MNARLHEIGNSGTASPFPDVRAMLSDPSWILLTVPVLFIQLETRSQFPR